MKRNQANAPIPRATFDRERCARQAAEGLLEDKERELATVNQQLIRDSEAMRAALAETEAMRARESAALTEQSILSQALAALSGKSSAAEAMQDVLTTLQSAFGIHDASFLQATGSDVRIAASVRADHVGLRLPLPDHFLSRSRRLNGLPLVAPDAVLPGGMADYASTLVAPLRMSDESDGALFLGCLESDRFSAKDLRLLERVAELAAQSFTALREARRNALLVALIEGRPIADQKGVLDAPLEAIHRAYARLTDLQGAAVNIFDDLFGTPLDEIDAAIDRALASLGEATNTDRVYVFRLREDADVIDNTHEWCASGIDPMREELQGIPAEMISHWRAAFDAGQDVTIPDVDALPDGTPEKEILQPQGIISLLAVPMEENGRFRGFVGYDAVRAQRTFVPSEVHLIRSVANVIASLIARREQSALINRLSEIARRTSNLVVMTDAERRITWVNDAFERVSGWSLGEIQGKNPGDVLQFDKTDPATIAQMRHALDRGAPVQVEVVNRTRDGHDYWVDLDIQPMRDATGALEGYMAVESDVTERHQQADALRAAAEDAAQARATLEALQDGFVLFDADDRLVICNQRFREIYPSTAEVIVPGVSYSDLLHYGLEKGKYADAKGREEEWLAERLEQHKATDSEVEQELSDGRWLRIFEKTTPDGGRVGLSVDITALKLSEMRAQADLSQAMEASQDGIAITDAEGRYVYMNAAHLAQFGYTSEAQVVGKPWTMLYEPGAAAWMSAHALPELAQHGRWSGEIMGKARDGSEVDQEVSLTLKDDGGILCIARDMRDRRRETAERDRLHQELQLAQRREVVGQMAAGLAHDFNNLLATISGGAALIQQTNPSEGLAVKGAQLIQSATAQAAGLVNRLLSLGRRESEPVVLDLRDPLREAGDLVRASLRAPSRLQITLPDTPVEVVADPTDVLQMVLNLAINGRDALANGAGTISIVLDQPDWGDLDGPFTVGKLDPGRRYCRIMVADTGAGMSPEAAARAFTPYETTKGAQGSGLGLTIVSSVVTRVGGALALTTAPGQGSTFTILWPEAPRPDRSVTAIEKLSGRLDGRTVLLLDDHQDLLVVLTTLLESAGAEVAPSSEPAEVIEALRDDPDSWDLLITDFDMPGMTGNEVAQAARLHARNLPIILVTALAGLAGRDTEIFDAVLGKPVDKETLVTAAEATILVAEKGEG